jgi:hypothetical protein
MNADVVVLRVRALVLFVQCFLNRRATVNQNAFVVARLQRMLGPTPATGPDAGVR